MASVAFHSTQPAVISPCLRFLIVAVASSVAIGPLLAQEAVEPSNSNAEASPAESPAKKATNAKPSKSLEETMRPEEFKAAGLDKLNEDELQHLDAYLQGYRQAAQKKANEQAQAKASEQIKKAQEQTRKGTKILESTKTEEPEKDKQEESGDEYERARKLAEKYY